MGVHISPRKVRPPWKEVIICTYTHQFTFFVLWISVDMTKMVVCIYSHSRLTHLLTCCCLTGLVFSKKSIVNLWSRPVQTVGPSCHPTNSVKEGDYRCIFILCCCRWMEHYVLLSDDFHKWWNYAPSTTNKQETYKWNLLSTVDISWTNCRQKIAAIFKRLWKWT